ncbi:MAG: TIM44-like domain-containing protein [Phreatobacter sp.]|uniref:Tim44 domain-containing protein n=1 Tax=Phreatobacter sp. TaxID=1966341 RepID=UPI001A3635E4|nr:TIM44-like domain-containing protein [Phreatobacter sp.]MBL8570961.1 TIM44-like domain-containing protein [Phreatobacter sp.]
MTSKTLLRILAMATVVVMVGATVAEARRSGSSGSRGERTHSAPPATSTAPTTAAPMQRTTAPAPAPGMNQPGMAPRPGMTPPAAQGSRWGGLGMGLAAGFLGAGLFGLLSGQGFLSGLGSMMGMLGFLFQFALIAGIIYLVVRLVRGRREQDAGGQPAMARMGNAPVGPMSGGNATPGGMPMGGGPIPGMAGGSVAPAPRAPSDTIGVTPQDYDQFERLLGNVCEAYSREDLNGLRAMATPEMVGYFADDLKDAASRGLVNRLSNVKLLQGDLSEAWREPDSDYATVAMRFAITDVMIDRASGRVVEGNPQGEEVIELWTFRRPHGAAWQLSAIQKT